MYYVTYSSIDAFKVSATLGGTPRDITSIGSGTILCWVIRASASLSVTDIAGDYKSSDTVYSYGQYIVPAYFSSPYPVDTTASKWRIGAVHSGSGGNWYTCNSVNTALSMSYAVWTTSSKTFQNNDVIICKNPVIINSSASFGYVYGSGDTNPVSIMICTNTQSAAS